MSYTAAINRANPACFMFLVDQSGSMTEPIGGSSGQPKMNAAAKAVNRAADTLVQRCSQGIEVRDYFDIAIIGYNTDSAGQPMATVYTGEGVPGNPFSRISEFAELAAVEEHTVKEDDGAGGIIEVKRQIPAWIRPEADYGTPMKSTLEAAAEAVEKWISAHPESYPPVIINVSDGQSTDGDPEPAAASVKSLATADGNALVFNVHLSKNGAPAVRYPSLEEELPPKDGHCRAMFRMSSPLPQASRERAEALEIPVTEKSRGYVFNADIVDLIQFLDIGTRAAVNLR